MSLSQEELLQLVQNEARAAIGFGGQSAELTESREIALEYYKGVMSDVPSLRGRSSIVSHDIADTIEAVMPDLVEIFEGDEVVNFVPSNSDDIAGAKQETDFVNYVFFNHNPGYEILYTAIRDALIMKIGVFVWHWEDGCPDVEQFKGKSEDEFMAAVATFGDMAQNKTAATPSLANEKQDPKTLLWDFQIVTPREGKCVVKAWKPEDVAVSDDTVVLGEGTYCAFRSRVRRGELLADGYDPDIISELPKYGYGFDQEIEQARDLVGEFSIRQSDDNNDPNLDLIEISYNYIRYPTEDGPQLYRVVTAGANAQTFLKSEPVDRVNASAICPYPQPHRFYGESLADKLAPIQRMKTAIWRVALDSAYYSMNGRFIVVENGMTGDTLSDLVSNTPGSVIRVKDPDAIQPLTSSELSFDPMEMLEYASVVGEQRSGVARASMGLTPDTLHDTSSGMLKLLSNAQRRVRTMARNFAEGGIKRLMLGIHDTVRENATMPQIARLEGSFVQVDPTSWGSRQDMSVEIAGAHGGRDYDMGVFGIAANLQTQLVQAQTQSKVDGQLVGGQNILNLANDMLKRAGVKNPERYFPPAYEPPPPQPPQPNPEMAKVEADAQANQQKLQFAQQQAAANDANAKARIANDARLREMEITLRNQLEQYKLQIDTAAKASQVDRELALKAQEVQISAHLQAVQTQLADENEKARIAEEAQRNQVDQTHDLIDMAHGHAIDEFTATLPPTKPGGDAAE